jgi:hypothetical protein
MEMILYIMFDMGKQILLNSLVMLNEKDRPIIYCTIIMVDFGAIIK